MKDVKKDEQEIRSLLVTRYKPSHPNISTTDIAILKQGTKAYKTATHLVINHTGGKQHNAIKIDTLRYSKDGFIIDEQHSITIDDDTSDEISQLITFMCSIKKMPDTADAYMVIPFMDYLRKGKSIAEAINVISTNDQAEVIIELLSHAKENPEILQAITKHISEDPQVSKETTAALNIARFSAALKELEELIKSDAKESSFQKLFEHNEWMFGSDYSTLLENRHWTRDEQQDFVLRRTADNYLEIIEIKTPLSTKPLFIEDESHDTLYARSELSAVIGQVTHYLEKLDAERHIIKSKDEEDVNKISAKIIIGRDTNKEQVAALRRLNGHLHRIEILTFDQLLRIARRVLSYQEKIISPTQEI